MSFKRSDCLEEMWRRFREQQECVSESGACALEFESKEFGDWKRFSQRSSILTLPEFNEVDLKKWFDNVSCVLVRVVSLCQCVFFSNAHTPRERNVFVGWDQKSVVTNA